MASHFITSKTKSFRAAEGGLWWTTEGLGIGMLHWLGKVRLGESYK